MLVVLDLQEDLLLQGASVPEDQPWVEAAPEDLLLLLQCLSAILLAVEREVAVLLHLEVHQLQCQWIPPMIFMHLVLPVQQAVKSLQSPRKAGKRIVRWVNKGIDLLKL